MTWLQKLKLLENETKTTPAERLFLLAAPGRDISSHISYLSYLSCLSEVEIPAIIMILKKSEIYAHRKPAHDCTSKFGEIPLSILIYLQFDNFHTTIHICIKTADISAKDHFEKHSDKR